MSVGIEITNEIWRHGGSWQVVWPMELLSARVQLQSATETFTTLVYMWRLLRPSVGAVHPAYVQNLECPPRQVQC